MKLKEAVGLGGGEGGDCSPTASFREKLHSIPFLEQMVCEM